LTLRSYISFLIILIVASVASAQQKSRLTNDKELYTLARTDLKAFAQRVSRDATSELGRAQAIVRWLAKNFEWKATDYQKRTVAEIIERRGGNCNELAMVALAAMKELNIKLRRVHEVNIYTNTPERGMRAREMVKEKGNAYSVFGRHHNDHVWLELFDSAANEWFPADPSSGLVGTKEWLKGRVWFGKRVTLNPITEDMIVPFAIFAADENGKFTVNRTRHYLVEEFDRLYSGKLHRQMLWKEWTSSLDLLDDKVGGAFAGNINLHEYESQIDSLAATYEEMHRAFQKR
jgi:Transglutaminase-like superfamily